MFSRMLKAGAAALFVSASCLTAVSASAQSAPAGAPVQVPPVPPAAPVETAEEAPMPMSSEDLEQLKTVTMACAALYEVRIDQGDTTPETAGKRDAMRSVFAILSSLSEEDAADLVSGAKGVITGFETAKIDELQGLCDAVAES